MQTITNTEAKNILRDAKRIVSVGIRRGNVVRSNPDLVMRGIERGWIIPPPPSNPIITKRQAHPELAGLHGIEYAREYARLMRRNAEHRKQHAEYNQKRNAAIKAGTWQPRKAAK